MLLGKCAMWPFMRDKSHAIPIGLAQWCLDDGALARFY